MNTLISKKQNIQNHHEGKEVLVYRDPIKRTDLEGKAILIERFQKHLDMEFWMVSFLADPEAICFRWVATND